MSYIGDVKLEVNELSYETRREGICEMLRRRGFADL